MSPRTPPASTSDHDTSGASKSKKAQEEESGIEPGGLCQPPGEDTVRPVFVYHCSFHPWHHGIRVDPNVSEPPERIKIIVGTAPFRKTFLIHKSVLCRHSDYFSTALKDGNEKRFIEAEKKEFEWPDDDPEEFHRWTRWLYACYTCQARRKYDAGHVCKADAGLAAITQSWCGPDVEAEQAFIFGDRILAREYCLYALSSFIQHVHLMEPSRILWTYENTPENSALHRFVRCWLGWMKFKFDKKEVVKDKEGVVAAYLNVFASLPGWNSIDPRQYDIKHWREPCSLQLHSICNHKKVHPYGLGIPNHRVPIVTRAQLRRRLIRRAVGLVWFGCCVAMLVLASYVFATDHERLLAHPMKVLSLVTACLTFVGLYTGGTTTAWTSAPMALLAFAAGIFSSHESARCIRADATGNISICKCEIGLATVEMLYVVLVGGILCAS